MGGRWIGVAVIAAAFAAAHTPARQTASAQAAHAPAAQPSAGASRTIRVRETAGIRRTEYPAVAHLAFTRGQLADPSQARLMAADAEVPAQFTATAQWDDGSVRTLDVDFNATLDPEQEQAYSLQYGAGVRAAAKRARGISAEASADGVQVGAVKFSKSGSPLIASAAFRGEGIAPGSNGLVVTDRNGQRHDLATATGARLDIIKSGPLVAALRYTATLPIEGAAGTPVAIDIEMPVSKTWVRLSATVQDPSRLLREVAIDTPLAFSAMPVLWDFGTDSGTYGAFRNAADTAVLTQSKSAAPGWKVETGTEGGPLRPYERSAGARVRMASGWAHLQDAKAAVAMAVERFGGENGTYTIALDGSGQTSFRFAPAAPAAQHHLTVYEHFVATPVAIGAATNPMAMLTPLAVTVER